MNKNEQACTEHILEEITKQKLHLFELSHNFVAYVQYLDIIFNSFKSESIKNKLQEEKFDKVILNFSKEVEKNAINFEYLKKTNPQDNSMELYYINFLLNAKKCDFIQFDLNHYIKLKLLEIENKHTRWNCEQIIKKHLDDLNQCQYKLNNIIVHGRSLIKKIRFQARHHKKLFGISLEDFNIYPPNLDLLYEIIENCDLDYINLKNLKLHFNTAGNTKLECNSLQGILNAIENNKTIQSLNLSKINLNSFEYIAEKLKDITETHPTLHTIILEDMDFRFLIGFAKLNNKRKLKLSMINSPELSYVTENQKRISFILHKQKKEHLFNHSSYEHLKTEDIYMREQHRTLFYDFIMQRLGESENIINQETPWFFNFLPLDYKKSSSYLLASITKQCVKYLDMRAYCSNSLGKYSRDILKNIIAFINNLPASTVFDKIYSKINSASEYFHIIKYYKRSPNNLLEELEESKITDKMLAKDIMNHLDKIPDTPLHSAIKNTVAQKIIARPYIPNPMLFKSVENPYSFSINEVPHKQTLKSQQKIKSSRRGLAVPVLSHHRTCDVAYGGLLKVLPS